MKVELIKKDAAMNFADVFPDVGDILENAFEHIITHENVVDGADPDDFEVYYANGEPTNSYGGAFITSIFGSYLLHDMREEQIAWYENDPTLCTVVFYSLSKLSDDDKQ